MAYNIQQFQSGCQCIIAEINFLSTFFKKMSKSAADYPKQSASFVPLRRGELGRSEPVSHQKIYPLEKISNTTQRITPNKAPALYRCIYNRKIVKNNCESNCLGFTVKYELGRSEPVSHQKIYSLEKISNTTQRVTLSNTPKSVQKQLLNIL